MKPNDPITYFAETDHRRKVPFGIKASDRTKHVYVIGKTGMGKSTMLENMAIQDIQNGNGIAFVDPHGQTAEKLLEYVPEERLEDVIYFAPFDMENPMSFNIMEDVGYDKRHLVANGLMSAFKKIWVDAWSARMEYILNNVILALLEYPDATLLGVNRMLTDKGYRKAVVDNITDPSTKSFWVDEFAKYTDRYTQEATPAIQNKVGQFTANPLIRNIIGQPKSSFDLREVMDSKKILIINLSKGRIGEGNANLLGSMIITKLYLAAMSRADLAEAELHKRPNFYLFVDEFQSFANESFADILSEARKYKLNLTIAHQYIEQMPEEVRAAVFGNVGTMIAFRVGAYDADVLEKEFAPKFYAEDMVNLGFTQIYLKLMIDGVSSRPFSATTLPPIQSSESNHINEVIETSRRLYSQPRIQVQDNIDTWYSKDFTPRKLERANIKIPTAPTRNPESKNTPLRPTAAVDNNRELNKHSNQENKVVFDRRAGERREESGERRGSVNFSQQTKSVNKTQILKPSIQNNTNSETQQKGTTFSQNNNNPNQKKTINDLKKEAAIKEIEKEKSNKSSLKDALSQLLNSEKSETNSGDSSKPKSIPKPQPRKERALALPNTVPEKKSEKEESSSTQVPQSKSEGGRDGATTPEQTTLNTVKVEVDKNHNATHSSTIKKSEVETSQTDSKQTKFRTPEVKQIKYANNDFNPSEKTTQKAKEVPEEVLKKVLGI